MSCQHHLRDELEEVAVGLGVVICGFDCVDNKSYLRQGKLAVVFINPLLYMSRVKPPSGMRRMILISLTDVNSERCLERCTVLRWDMIPRPD